MRIRRTLYGWLCAPGVYAVGTRPPDPVPYRTETFDSIRDAETAAEAKRAVIVWSGPARTEKLHRKAMTSARDGLAANGLANSAD